MPSPYAEAIAQQTSARHTYARPLTAATSTARGHSAQILQEQPMSGPSQAPMGTNARWPMQSVDSQQHIVRSTQQPPVNVPQPRRPSLQPSPRMPPSNAWSLHQPQHDAAPQYQPTPHRPQYDAAPQYQPISNRPAMGTQAAQPQAFARHHVQTAARR
jgi:hypothetical protein